jgi:hypothetical protein
VREGVLFFVRSTFGTTTLISGPFEIDISHAQDHVVATPGRTDHAAVVPGTVKGREALDLKGRHTPVLKWDKFVPLRERRVTRRHMGW